MIASSPFTAESLQRCFVSMKDIPPEYRTAKSSEEMNYILDGEVRPWEGAFAEVSSPICLPQADGSFLRPVIGRVPAMDEAAVLAGLNAAVRAWDHGRGAWPTMSVAGRIAAVERFATEMLKVRREVVNLLMWEIGKSLDDSNKEFDRTWQYIHKTVEALKEIDR